MKTNDKAKAAFLAAVAVFLRTEANEDNAKAYEALDAILERANALLAHA